jgi:type IV pilus assembly protein PilO
MFEKLPFYGKALVFAGLSAAIVVCAYFVYPKLGQMQAKNKEYEARVADMQSEIRKGKAIEQRLPEIEREIAGLERKLEDIKTILPSAQETGDLLRWIKNLGDQSNLDLKSFAPGALRPVEFYKEFPIEMQVTGRYHDLGIFLDRVSKYPRIINVDNLQVASAKEPGKTIRASLTATTFVYAGDDALKEATQ